MKKNGQHHHGGIHSQFIHMRNSGIPYLFDFFAIRRFAFFFLFSFLLTCRLSPTRLAALYALNKSGSNGIPKSKFIGSCTSAFASSLTVHVVLVLSTSFAA
jgi:hypothetical protein